MNDHGRADHDGGDATLTLLWQWMGQNGITIAEEITPHFDPSMWVEASTALPALQSVAEVPKETVLSPLTSVRAHEMIVRARHVLQREVPGMGGLMDTLCMEKDDDDDHYDDDKGMVYSFREEEVLSMDEDDMEARAQWLLLTLVLVVELLHGSSSSWFPYLCSLPRSEPLIATWFTNNDAVNGDDNHSEEDDKDKLDDTDRHVVMKMINSVLVNTQLEDDIHREARRLRSLYEFCSGLMQRFGEDLPPNGRLSFGLFCRAWILATSRGFLVDDEHMGSMVPVADMFNHKCCAVPVDRDDEDDGFDDDDNDDDHDDGNHDDEGLSEYDDAHGSSYERDKHSRIATKRTRNDAQMGSEQREVFEKRLRKLGESKCHEWEEGSAAEEEIAPPPPLQIAISDADDHLVITTMSPIMKGSQIFNTYGQYGNDLLLRDYGFVAMQNAFTSTSCNGRQVLYSVEYVLRDRDTRSGNIPTPSERCSRLQWFFEFSFLFGVSSMAELVRHTFCFPLVPAEREKLLPSDLCLLLYLLCCSSEEYRALRHRVAMAYVGEEEEDQECQFEAEMEKEGFQYFHENLPRSILGMPTCVMVLKHLLRSKCDNLAWRHLITSPAAHNEKLETNVKRVDTSRNKSTPVALLRADLKRFAEESMKCDSGWRSAARIFRQDANGNSRYNPHRDCDGVRADSWRDKLCCALCIRAGELEVALSWLRSIDRNASQIR